MIPIIFMLVRDSGDESFVLQIYDRFKRLMFKIAGEYGSTPEDREEIFQIAVLRLVNSVSALRKLDASKLPSYIATLTRNTAINYLKHNNVVLKHRANVEEDEIPAGSFSVSPEEYILRKEKWELMLKALGKLSESDRLVLGGKLMLELPDEELAAILGCKPQSVSMKLTRARRRAMWEIMRMEQDDGS